MNGNILITGINGFVGSHLAEFLLRKKTHRVHGTRRHFRSNVENIAHIMDQLALHECDLKDLGSAHRVMHEVKPEIIFHLAAQSFVGDSYKSPGETLFNNLGGALNILEAVRMEREQDKTYDPIIHMAGSSEEYGLVLPGETPITETNPLRPQSPYGVSKIAQTHLAGSYWRTYGIRVVVTRAFNHTGPRRGEIFATSSFARQVAQIEQGVKKDGIIRHGNLDAQRDFTDVRDMTAAYWLAATRCDPGEIYNICSGTSHAIRSVLEFLVRQSSVPIKTQEDPARLRPSDVPILLGSAAKFREKTGWQPTIPFETTLSDLLNYWREKVKRSS